MTDQPKIIRRSAWTRVGLVALGSTLGLGSLAGGTWLVVDLHSLPIGLAVSALFLPLAALGAAAAWSAWWSVIALWPDRLETFDGFRRKVLRQGEVAGLRSVPNSETRIRVVTKDGRTATLDSYALKDETLLAWLEGFPDLDVADRKASLKAIMNDPALGATHQARRKALRRMLTIAQIGKYVGWATGLWLLFWPTPYEWAIATGLLLPPAALVLHLLSGRAYALDEARNDLRPSLVHLFLTPSLALALRTVLDDSFLDWRLLLIYTGAGTVAACLLVAVIDGRQVRKWYGWLAVALFTAAYSYGLVGQVDTLLDRAEARIYPVTVLGKHIDSDSKHTSYYVSVTPWGAEKETSDVSVTAGFYSRIAVGQHLCMGVQPGALGIRWDYLAFC
jgi:hypothetical protein